MADQTPETPEALASRWLDQLGETEDADQALAALIAQHTAELTARIRELEAANLELGLELKRGELGVTTVALMASKERIAALEAQLAASAQREASARAEAREAALRELVESLELNQPQPDPAYDSERSLHEADGYESAVTLAKQLLTSPPPPRVDAWVRTAERVPPNSDPVQVASGGVVQLVAWRYIAFVDGWECAVDVTGDDEAPRSVFDHWQPLPPPPSAEPAKEEP